MTYKFWEYLPEAEIYLELTMDNVSGDDCGSVPENLEYLPAADSDWLSWKENSNDALSPILVVKPDLKVDPPSDT